MKHKSSEKNKIPPPEKDISKLRETKDPKSNSSEIGEEDFWVWLDEAKLYSSRLELR